MKIAFILLDNPFERIAGGIESFVFQLSTALAEIGNEVWVVCLGDIKCETIQQQKNVHLWILPSSAKNLFLKSISFARYSSRIAKRLDNMNFDIFLGQGGLAAPLFFVKPRNGLVFVTVHTLDGQNIANIKDCLRLGNFKDMILEIAKFLTVKIWRTLYLRRADRLIFVSKSVKLEFMRYYPFLRRKAYVIPNGSPESFVIHPFEEREHDFIFVGRLDKCKCVDVFVKAIEELVKKGYTLSVPIIGTGPYKKRITKLVSDSDLNETISILGYLPHRDLLEYIGKSKFLVMPSVYESDPLVLKEALAMGTPCIVSNIPSLIELIHNGKNGFVYGGDYHFLSLSMEKAMKLNSNEFNKLVLSAKDSISQTSWRKISRDYLKVFNQK
jgi:glycosyltransferase involved in cell wall biosynthesis